MRARGSSPSLAVSRFTGLSSRNATDCCAEMASEMKDIDLGDLIENLLHPGEAAPPLEDVGMDLMGPCKLGHNS